MNIPPALPPNTKAEDAILGAAKAHPVAARYVVGGNRVYDTPDHPVIAGDPPLLCTCESIEDAHIVARALNLQPFSDRILDLVGRVGDARKVWDEASDAAGRALSKSKLSGTMSVRVQALIEYEDAEGFCTACCRAHRIAEDALLAAFREGVA